MRLDAETASSTYVENVVADAAVNERTSEANNALRDGIKAAQGGDRAKARTALLRASELDPQSETAWLWLASISEYPEELVVFLNNVLDINPGNARALEWMSATKALLSKTFVERGVDAMDSGQRDLAAQYFDQALQHDQRNTAAWLWLANLSDSSEGKISYLEKVLEIDPENEAAKAAYDLAKHNINQALLAEARTAAVAGRRADAHDLLDAFIAENPASEEGWILRSHLADGFAEKVAAFEKVLEINPGNIVARSGLDSLKAIMETVMGNVQPQPATIEVPDLMENTAQAVEQERIHETEAAVTKGPTQELVFPEAASTFAERKASFNVPDDFQYAPEQSSEAERTMFGTELPVYEDSTYPSSEADRVHASDSFEFSVNSHPSDHVVGEFSEENSRHVETELYVVEEADAVDGFFGAPGQSSPEYGVGDTFSFTPSVAEPETTTTQNFEAVPGVHLTSVETNAGQEEKSHHLSVSVSLCPFCSGANPSQAFTCESCLATLTLSDIEMMLANTHADKSILRGAVEQLENERDGRPFSSSELMVLGIGHLNLRDFQAGYDRLLEASQLDPNNVVLAGQVNSLHIRLEEIKEQEAEQQLLPKGKSILVVDDSATVRKLIAGKLEKSGHEVYCAADGVEALDQLDSVTPDLILLDITMPRMDGYQVCKVIRSKESTKDIPVVMISGKDGFFDKVRGRMAGTTGYITKPFGPETLMKAVETYLKGGQVE